MGVSESLQQLVDRHAAFWRRDPVREPILRVRPYRPLGIGGHFGRFVDRVDGVDDGGLIEPGRLVFHPEEPDAVVDGPLLCGLQLPGICWTEALVGCPVRMETGGAWAESFLAGEAETERRCDAGGPADGPWLRSFREGTRALVAHAAGRLPVIQPLLRGPLDMMASALGHEAMVTRFLDSPQSAERFLALCSKLFVALAREHHALVPAFLGGSVIFGLWAPGEAVRTQLDNAVLLSPELYRRHVLPHDAVVFRSFRTVVIHVHSGCLHIVEELLASPDLDAIQVSIDFPGGPLAEEILPALRRIQSRKPLIVTGPVTAAELSILRGRPPEGVALDLQLVEA